MLSRTKGLVVVLIIVLMLSILSFAAGVTKTIEVVLNSVSLAVNGTKIKADTILYNGTTYVPLRAVAEMLGKEVGWDQATQTASINDKTGSTTNPTTGAVSYSRINPASTGIKQTVSVSNILETYTAEIMIKEVIRGSKALDMIIETNNYNEIPKDDEEYILAKIYVKILNSKDDKKIGISGHSFELFNEGNTKYDEFYSVVIPSPQLSTELYAGAEHEGYAAFKVKKTDANPKICYGANYDGTGGIWFRLSE